MRNFVQKTRIFFMNQLYRSPADIVLLTMSCSKCSSRDHVRYLLYIPATSGIPFYQFHNIFNRYFQNSNITQRLDV